MYFKAKNGSARSVELIRNINLNTYYMKRLHSPSLSYWFTFRLQENKVARPGVF